ncbi:MAG: hypothetical protein ACRC14_03725, partial [Paracoccaceae bacterium]
ADDFGGGAMTSHYLPKPGSLAFTDRVGSWLRDGYGVEDIALKLECSPSDVRKQVALFRGAGLLKKWFHHG